MAVTYIKKSNPVDKFSPEVLARMHENMLNLHYHLVHMKNPELSETDRKMLTELLVWGGSSFQHLILALERAKGKDKIISHKEKTIHSLQHQLNKLNRIMDPTGIVNMYFLLKGYVEGKETDVTLRSKADVVLERVKKEVLDDPEGELTMPQSPVQPQLATGARPNAMPEVWR